MTSTGKMRMPGDECGPLVYRKPYERFQYKNTVTYAIMILSLKTNIKI